MASAPTADALVIFGITGDLARKMTLRSLYRLEQRELLGCPILGVAIDDWTVEHLRDHARACIEATNGDVDDKVFRRLASRLSYVSGDFADSKLLDQLRDELGNAKAPVFYLEIPPSLFAIVVEGLSKAGLITPSTRVVVEKPFGHDLSSAKALARSLHKFLDESQLLR